MSGYYRHSLEILAQTASTSSSLPGTARALSTNQHDLIQDREQNFAAVFHFALTGGTSPTLDAVVETSFDGGTVWVPVANMTQIAGAQTRSQLVAITAPLGRHVRARTTNGGTAAGSYTGSVRLVSNAGISF